MAKEEGEGIIQLNHASAFCLIDIITHDTYIKDADNICSKMGGFFCCCHFDKLQSQSAFSEMIKLGLTVESVTPNVRIRYQAL